MQEIKQNKMIKTFCWVITCGLPYNLRKRWRRSKLNGGVRVDYHTTSHNNIKVITLPDLWGVLCAPGGIEKREEEDMEESPVLYFIVVQGFRFKRTASGRVI